MTTTERPGLSRAEPPPISNDSPAIADLVIADMIERKAAGVAKYGVPLQANNGRKPLIDAYQEALDLTCYLRQAIAEGYIPRGDYDDLVAKLSEARLAANRANEGYWIWQGDGHDYLDSMGSTMPVSITAGQLRDLIERESAEWRTMALRYQARHATLRGLQRAVMDAVTSIEDRNDPMLDAIADRLIAALGNPTPVDDLGRTPQEQHAWDVLVRIADNAERQQPEPLPDVDTLRQWMRDETPVFLTFDGGARLIDAGELPEDRGVGRATVAGVMDGPDERSVRVRLPSGRKWCLAALRCWSATAGCHSSRGHRPERTTVAEPSLVSRAGVIEYPTGPISREYREPTEVCTTEQLATHVGIPAVDEQPWTEATDPVVETWVGKRIECSHDGTGNGPFDSGELLSVGAYDLDLNMKPKYPEPQLIDRSSWRVRLAEVSK